MKLDRLLLLALLIVGLSCNVLSGGKEPVASVYGQLKDEFRGDVTSAKGVTVILGDSVLELEESGAYKIENLSPGDYTIRFESEYYIATEREFTLSEDDALKLDIYLESIQLDLVPLFKDSKWTYEVKTGDRFFTEVSEITDMIETDNYFRYQFISSLNGYEIVDGDTSDIDITGSFDIVEYKSNGTFNIENLSNMDSFGYGEPVPGPITVEDKLAFPNEIIDFQRYLPYSRMNRFYPANIDLSDGRDEVETFYGLATVRVNIGVTKIDLSGCGNSGCFYDEKTLVDFINGNGQ